MLCTSLVNNKLIPENFGIIDKSGNLQGTNINLHRKTSTEPDNTTNEITIEKVQQAIVALKRIQMTNVQNIFNAYLYGDSAVYSESIGQTTTKNLCSQNNRKHYLYNIRPSI